MKIVKYTPCTVGILLSAVEARQTATGHNRTVTNLPQSGYGYAIG